MAGLPRFDLRNIKDEAMRDNFELLQEFFRVQSPLLGFKHFEIKFEAAQTNFRFNHSLGFQPKDIIQTSVIGSGVVTFNYEKFTIDSLDITVTGACTVRFFAGTYNSKP